MERKVGEQFYYGKVLLEVVIADKKRNDCPGCYFRNKGELDSIYNSGCDEFESITGDCIWPKRIDGNEVIFKRVKKKKAK